MNDFCITFHNDATERDIRMAKLRQKIGGCLRVGAFCRICCQACKQEGQSPLSALGRVPAGKPLTCGSCRR